uniref:Uncharacterized protein n=1 Tax=Strombidium rassoulzadegani TaxID=1082188 RepID=A0A7S3FX39_9SPIT|mmetsp:Transcript_2896/g.4926  ORF Transcript_2896/g.4926 Transcript_2896/m.4926 type:complete len:126 (+) Transcript_2896:239-616(+)
MGPAPRAVIAPPEAPPEKITIPDTLPGLDDPFWNPYRDRPTEPETLPEQPKTPPPAEPQIAPDEGDGDDGGKKTPGKRPPTTRQELRTLPVTKSMIGQQQPPSAYTTKGLFQQSTFNKYSSLFSK